MNNNQTWGQRSLTDDMENWKKKIIMDPLLNSLFDQSVSADDLLVKKIMPLSLENIALTFSKLSTINAQLMQNMQKQVEFKSHFIEKSYLQFLDYKEEISEESDSLQINNKPIQCLNYLKSFNKKYEKIEDSLTLWKNITAVLHFSKGLQTFRVNSNILRTLMRGYSKQNQQTINPLKVAKMLKQLTQLSSCFHFDGISSFQSERAFISGVKNTITEIGCKKLNKLIQQYVNLGPKQQTLKRNTMQKSVQQWIGILHNLKTLREVVVNLVKNMFPETTQKTKKYLQSNVASNILNLSTNMSTILLPFYIQNSKRLIFLQQKLITMRKVQFSEVPNFFIKYWQKLCEYIHDTIDWNRKDQQSRNMPSSRQTNFIWKYPLLYNNFSLMCSSVQGYILETVTYNCYNFAKNKQKLMVHTLLDIGIKYHNEVDKVIKEIKNVIEAKNKEDVEIYIKNLTLIFGEASCVDIYNSLMNSLCSKLNQISQSIHNLEDKQEKKSKIELLNQLKSSLKEVIANTGANYGISLRQLSAFKFQNIDTLNNE